MLFILASVSFMLLDKRLFSDSILTKLKCSCEAVCFVLLTLESGEHDNGAFLPVISIFFFINLLKNSFIFAPDCIICLSLSCCHFLNASRLFLLSSWDFCISMALFFFDSVSLLTNSLAFFILFLNVVSIFNSSFCRCSFLCFASSSRCFLILCSCSSSNFLSSNKFFLKASFLSCSSFSVSFSFFVINLLKNSFIFAPDCIICLSLSCCHFLNASRLFLLSSWDFCRSMALFFFDSVSLLTNSLAFFILFLNVVSIFNSSFCRCSFLCFASSSRCFLILCSCSSSNFLSSNKFFLKASFLSCSSFSVSFSFFVINLLKNSFIFAPDCIICLSLSCCHFLNASRLFLLSSWDFCRSMALFFFDSVSLLTNSLAFFILFLNVVSIFNSSFCRCSFLCFASSSRCFLILCSCSSSNFLSSNKFFLKASFLSCSSFSVSFSFFVINLLKNSFIFAPDCIICLSLSCCHFLNASRLFLLSSWDFCRSMALFFFDSVSLLTNSLAFFILFLNVVSIFNSSFCRCSFLCFASSSRCFLILCSCSSSNFLSSNKFFLKASFLSCSSFSVSFSFFVINLLKNSFIFAPDCIICLSLSCCHFLNASRLFLLSSWDFCRSMALFFFDSVSLLTNSLAFFILFLNVVSIFNSSFCRCSFLCFASSSRCFLILCSCSSSNFLSSNKFFLKASFLSCSSFSVSFSLFVINLLKNSFIFAPDCIICLSLSCCHFLNASRLFLLSSWDFCRSMALFFFDSVSLLTNSLAFFILFLNVVSIFNSSFCRCSFLCFASSSRCFLILCSCSSSHFLSSNKFFLKASFLSCSSFSVS